MPTKEQHVEYYGDIDAYLADTDVQEVSEILVKVCKKNMEVNLKAGSFPDCLQDENPDVRRLALLCFYRDIHGVMSSNEIGFDGWELPMWRLSRLFDAAFTSDVFDQSVRDKLMSFLKDAEARIT